MATVELWPAHISECPQMEWSETPATGIVSFNPEVGDPLERQRISHPGASIQATWHFETAAEKDAFLDFHRRLLKNGSLSFRFRTNPFGSGRYKLGIPTVSRVGPERFEASATLRRLPGAV